MEIRFRIAKYALQTVIESLQNESCGEFKNEIYVTKEDGDLVVVCEKKYRKRGEELGQITAIPPSPGVDVKKDETCEKCGGTYHINYSKILTSSPPQYEALCESCGNKKYFSL